MAGRGSVTPNGAGTRRMWFVAACLVVLFVAALFLRAYWNLDAAHPSAGTFILSGGSDPYYHKRVVDQVQANGFHWFLGDSRHGNVDPLLNYPKGDANPNPPIYEGSIAYVGKLLEPFFHPQTAADGTTLSALQVSTWYVDVWSPVVFSALTLFPIYFIGAALFDRRAGLVAALLWVVSTSAMDAGGLGLSDHDSAVMLFVCLAMLFYIQAIRSFRGDGNWVAKWSDGSSVSSGLGNLFRARGSAFAYAALAAFSIAGVALIWKGFNYVIGIIFLYAALQMVIDHWRNRDSTGVFLVSLIAMVGGVLIALPYYNVAGVSNFLQPTWYILAAFVIAGIVLVPTRDLPTILVLPIAGVVGLLLAAAAFFVFPTVAQSLLYATVYFKQTRLYTTIAEAHPANFSDIVFGVGPLAFFLAVIGWIVAVFKIHETSTLAWTRLGMGALVIIVVGAIAAGIAQIPGDLPDTIALLIFGLGLLSGLALILGGSAPQAPAWVFAIIWGGVAVFMAQSAVRFLINAIPIFCVFAGFYTIWLLDWLDFGAIRKSLAANRGNAWQGFRRGVRPLHIVAVVLIVLLFVAPTALLAADAALPPEAEQKLAHDASSDFMKSFYSTRMGAYGQGFSQVTPWIPPLEFLNKYDANISDPAARPAFISWWDYGHWAIAISDHPAVADNFQNGYEMAANYILAQDEAHSIQLLASRLAESPGSDLQSALTQVNSTNPAQDAKDIQAWKKVNLSVEQSAQLLSIVEKQTGKSIRYFATDIRMLPFDNPATQNIEASSIYYAPVKLKGDNPDDYVTTQVNLGQAIPGHPDGYVTVDQYDQLAKNPITPHQTLGERYVYTQKFFDSMFWRAYVGTPVQPQGTDPITGTLVEQAVGNPRPSFGLEHYRAIYIGQLAPLYRGDAQNPYLYYPEVILTEYYPGAVVTGTVTEDGAPLAGVTVTALDDVGTLFAQRFPGAITDPSVFNVPHQSVTTDAHGNYKILAPFNMEGGNTTLIVTRGAVKLGETHLNISRADADSSREFPNVAITVQKGSVSGRAFHDANADGVFNETNDTPAANVNVSIGGVTATTDADGNFTVANVPAGEQSVTTDTPGLTVVPASGVVTVQPGQTTKHDVGLQAKPATVSGVLFAPVNGTDTPTKFVSLAFEPDTNVTGNTAVAPSRPVITDPAGNYSVSLAPGSYVISATYTPSGSTDTYTLHDTITVQAGDVITGRDLHMAKQ